MNFNYNTGMLNMAPQINSNSGTTNNAIQNNATTQTQNIPKTEILNDNIKPLNQDTITICGKKIEKKKAIVFGIGSLIAIAGAAAAIIYAIRHHKKINLPQQTPTGGNPGTILPPGGKTAGVSENAKLLNGEPKEIAPAEARARKFITRSKEATKQAKECKKRALKTSKKVESTIDDVQTLFNSKAKTTADGRKIEFANGVMKEFAADNTTVQRLSTFDNGTPKTIEEFIDSTKKNLIEFNPQKHTVTYKENLRQVAGESLHDREVLLYKGKLNRYIEGIKECADNSATYQRMLDFHTNGNMDVYAEKCEFSSIGEKFAKKLDFEISREMPNEYAENFIRHIDGRETFGKNLSFIPGVDNPNAYTEGYEKLTDGSTKSKINTIFSKKGIIIGYEENSVDGEKWDKCFKRSHGKWYMEPSSK